MKATMRKVWVTSTLEIPATSNTLAWQNNWLQDFEFMRGTSGHIYGDRCSHESGTTSRASMGTQSQTSLITAIFQENHRMFSLDLNSEGIQALIMKGYRQKGQCCCNIDPTSNACSIMTELLNSFNNFGLLLYVLVRQLIGGQRRLKMAGMLARLAMMQKSYYQALQKTTQETLQIVF